MAIRDKKGRFIKGISHSPTTQFKKGGVPWNKGKKTGLVTKAAFKKGQRNSPNTEFKKGHTTWNKGLKGVQPSTRKGKKLQPLSVETRKKISQSLKINYKETNRVSVFANLKRENHWNWKGGITPTSKLIRESLEYEEWRTKVFERDNYTCVECDAIGGYLHADHIKSFADYPELRLELSNGRTLCVPCHYQLTFGKEMPKNSKWGKSFNKEGGNNLWLQ